MKLDSLPGASFTNATETIDYDISKQNHVMVMDMLATRLYSDPILAPIREIITNAFDAHLMVGKKDVPVAITSPTKFSPLFVVRDFGPGISQEMMPSVLSFGHSSKREDENATGGFGIGIKSPYAVTNDFLLTSYQGGKVAIWRSYKMNGKPKAALLHYGPTEEPDGVKFEIPITIDMLPKFNQAIADFLPFVKSTYTLAPDLTLNYYVYDTKDTGLPFAYYSSDFSKTSRFTSGPAFVRMGDILYKIPNEVMTACSNFNVIAIVKTAFLAEWYNDKLNQMKVSSYRTLILDLPVGAIPISPSREEIINSPSSIKILKNLFESKLVEYTEKAYNSFDSYYADKKLAIEAMAVSSLVSNNHWHPPHMLDGITTNKIRSLLRDQNSELCKNLAIRFGCTPATVYLKASEPLPGLFFLPALINNQSFIDDVGLKYVNINFLVSDPKRTEMVTYDKNSTFTRRHGSNNSYTSKFPDYVYDLLANHNSPISKDITCFTPRSYFFFGVHNTTGKGYSAVSCYYATKPLSEIKDPINRLIVASYFELMPEKTAAAPKTVSRTATTKFLKRSQETPPVYTWNGKNWSEFSTTEPLKNVLLMRYKTGVSRTFSEHNDNIDSATYKKAIANLPCTKHLIALRDDMVLDTTLYPDAITPEEYAAGPLKYHVHEYQWIRGLHNYQTISVNSIVLNPKVKDLFDDYGNKKLTDEETRFLFSYLSKFLPDVSFVLDPSPKSVSLHGTLYTYKRTLTHQDMLSLYDADAKRHIAKYILPLVADPWGNYGLPILKFLRDPTFVMPPEYKSFAAVFPQIVADYFKVELEDATVLPPELLSTYTKTVIEPLFEYHWPSISLKGIQK